MPAPANSWSILSSVLCWCQCLNRAHADTDQTSVKCWAYIKHQMLAGRLTTLSRVGLHTIYRPHVGSMLAHQLLCMYNPEPALYHNACPPGGRYAG